MTDYLVAKQFWNVYANNKPGAQLIFGILSKLQRVMGVGMLLVIISGVGMMIYVHTVYGQQLWFRIKIALVLIVIAAGLGFRRRLGKKIGDMLSGQNPEAVVFRIRKNLNLVHISLFILLFGIFALSVFKIN